MSSTNPTISSVPHQRIPDGSNTPIDPNIAAALPQPCRVLSITRHGQSFWNYTGRIDIQRTNPDADTENNPDKDQDADADSGTQPLFIKLVSTPDNQNQGHDLVYGEFESMKAIHTVTPDFAPRPLATGTLASNPSAHFLLTEYINMSTTSSSDPTQPTPSQLAPRLARLHRESKSPTGHFGFHVPTYAGTLPQVNEWCASWEAFFARNLRWAVECEGAAKGRDERIDELMDVVMDVVVPRLIRPLESGGRRVEPALVHGDLWFGNAGVEGGRVGGERAVVFDACSFYAHNEYEFGQWRPACNRFGPEYLQEYHKYNEISEPKEDYEGRLDLYKLRFNTHVSALFPDDMRLREQMLGDMEDLVQRYG